METARALGISEVPTVVVDGRYAVTGTQPEATYLKVLDEVAGLAGRD